MEYVRWRAEADKAADDGSSQMAHWEAAAKRGSQVAIAKLNGPPIPESVEYLLPWLYELHGRSGAHMAGLNPLSYATISSWAVLTNRVPSPLEVEALIQMDAVLLGAYRDEPDDEPVETPAWPEKKDG